MFTVLEILHIYKTPFSIILKSLSPTQSWCLKKDCSSTSNLQFIYSLAIASPNRGTIAVRFKVRCVVELLKVQTWQGAPYWHMTAE